MPELDLVQDNLVELIRELYEQVSSQKNTGKDTVVEEELEATLHELSVYQEELHTQSENLRSTVQELDFLYRKYVNLFDFAPIGYFAFDQNGIITEVNLTGAELLGFDRRRLVGKPMFLYVTAATRDKFLSHLRGVFQEIHGSVEVDLINNENKSIPVVIESLPMRDEHGEIAFCRAAVMDITERKLAESELRKAHNDLEKRVAERTRELRETNQSLQKEIERRKQAEAALSEEKEMLDITLQGISDGVITTDLDGRIIMMNGVAEELTGWSKAQSQGRQLNEVVKIMNETSRKGIENPVHKVLISGCGSEMTNHTVLTSKKGQDRRIEHSAKPVRNDQGEMIGAVLVIRDVTQEKRLEEERLKANKLESLGFLAGGIAHDFNNLLTAIWGNVSLAKLHLDDKNETLAILDKAEGAFKRTRHLTQQLLTFSKGGSPIKKATTISNLIRESAEFVMRGTSVRCKFNFADNLRPVEVDEGQISQVVDNLVINAIQAMPNGGEIQIGARNTQVTTKQALPLKNGKYVLISVRDTGEGMPKDILDKVFDPYFTTKDMDGHKGHGLGLATSYSIIKKHGGLITVESELNKGTTFFVYLPVSTKSARLKKTELTTLKSGQGRILVMDDEEMLLEISKRCLERIGYEVLTARDGAEAIQIYQRAKDDKPVDAVIMDLTIPGGMGGREAIQKLRKIDPNVKAVVSSGYSNDPVMANYRDHGFTAVIEKPFRLADLNAVINQVVVPEAN